MLKPTCSQVTVAHPTASRHDCLRKVNGIGTNCTSKELVNMVSVCRGPAPGHGFLGNGDRWVRWVEVWWSYWRGGWMSNRGVYPQGSCRSIIWEWVSHLWGLWGRNPWIIPCAAEVELTFERPTVGVSVLNLVALGQSMVLIVINPPQIGELMDVGRDKTTWRRVYSVSGLRGMYFETWRCATRKPTGTDGNLSNLRGASIVFSNFNWQIPTQSGSHNPMTRSYWT